MDFMTRLLGRIAYEFFLIQPLIPLYLHIIFSAVFSIFIGAHASLSKPSSAAEPSKSQKASHGDNDEEDIFGNETTRKMEGMSPMDALTLPLLAGGTLAGLYFLIKWLEDPALLNKILNYYFSIFGIVAVTMLLGDAVAVATSFAFPSTYTYAGKVWKVDQKLSKMICLASQSGKNLSPLPGWLSTLQLPKGLTEQLWSLRNLLTAKLRVRVHLHKVFTTSFRVRVPSLVAFFVAVIAVGYYAMIDKPWWLTNLLGISLAYNALQLMSPTTFWTGTMVLASLFLYDIYFVFFTPLMVTVAKKLDIPAKLLFPRPSGSGEDPSMRSLAMLGLGDIVLPGIMIGLALRFDLYLFYLRKQVQPREIREELLDKEDDDDKPVRVEWISATGGWGERFWIGRANGNLNLKELSGVFPKRYFHASLSGYLFGMIITLGIMQFYGHAQPALLYLVPGVLGALWGTALIRGETKLMWQFSEATDSEPKKSLLSPSRLGKTVARLEPTAKEPIAKENAEESMKVENAERATPKGIIHDLVKDQLFFVSVSFPNIGSRDDGQSGNRTGEEAKKTSQLSSAEELSLPSIDKARSSKISTNMSSALQENTIQAQEPPEKRQRLG